ncbi:hypothetical protein ASZ90_001609 [hydrocarbon metagenome]|uniref:Uncharacterized protein n=1 Tax=hydrocarbon metagenome TaxID=938273 RepID=A0A0W8G5S8_9ZZZZ
MPLVIRAHGDIEQVLVTALHKNFVSKVFRHCWGKNNTPYFAGNCFKGVLYFDERMAAAFARESGVEWNGWLALPKHLHLIAAVFESGLELSVSCRGREIRLGSSGLDTRARTLTFSAVAGKIGDDQVTALLGSVDKGAMVFTLADFDGEFEPDKLSAEVTRLDDFFFEDALVTGLFYDGREMSMEMGDSRGMSMIDPVLIDTAGQRLDMYDFTA